MTVHLVIAEGLVDEQRETRVLAVTKTKAAAQRIRKAHREKVKPVLDPRPPFPDVTRYESWDADWAATNAWHKKVRQAAEADMPDLPLELWLDKWRIESHEVV